MEHDIRDLTARDAITAIVGDLPEEFTAADVVDGLRRAGWPLSDYHIATPAAMLSKMAKEKVLEVVGRHPQSRANVYRKGKAE